MAQPESMYLCGFVAGCCKFTGMASATDAELQIRKKTLLESLYFKYSSALLRFLHRQRVAPEDAVEIVQETWCRLHQVGNLEEIKFPQAYLFRTAGNLANDSRKRRQRWDTSERAEVEIIELESDAPGPYRILKGEQELAIVRAALMGLSPKCRRVFIMHRFEEVTYHDIARELGISVSMVEKYIIQALAHLKARLDEARVSAPGLRAPK